MRTRPILPAWPLAVGFVLLAVAAVPPADAQVPTRSDEIGAPAGVRVAAAGRYVFAGVGIDEYQNTAVWKALDNAVNDVTRVRETLVDDFEFESPDTWVLTDAQATQLAIRQLIDELRANLRPDDNLIFFYAGHGVDRPDLVGGEEVGRTGFIVPVEAKLPVTEAASQYIEIEDLLEALARLPARHVLVILDSCYSGMALEGSFKMRGEAPTQQAVDLISRVSRRVLTSARSEQLAADGGEGFPENSLFTGWLVEGLRRATEGGGTGTQSSDGDGDGMVTATEIYNFVSGRVGQASDSRQTPDFGAFELDQRGELVLTLERDPFDDLYAQATAAYEEAKFDGMLELVADALEVQEQGPRPAYLRYLAARVDDDLGASLAALRAIAAHAGAGEDVPMSRGDLAIELRKAESQCSKRGCAVPGGV